MFILSQVITTSVLKSSNENSTLYSIVIGLIFYSVIYLGLLYKNQLVFFNQFIHYIIGLDLLLSGFYYYQKQKAETFEDESEQQQIKDKIEESEELESEEIEHEIHDIPAPGPVEPSYIEELMNQGAASETELNFEKEVEKEVENKEVDLEIKDVKTNIKKTVKKRVKKNSEPGLESEL
jgi:hypothetical protein